jgi:hypothetical protein
LASLSTTKRNAFRADFCIVDEKIRLGVTAKRVKSADAHWGQWESFGCKKTLTSSCAGAADLFQSSKSSPSVAAMDESPPTIMSSNLIPFQTLSTRWARRLPNWGPMTSARMPMATSTSEYTANFRAYTKEDDLPSCMKPVPIIIIYILQ